MAEPDLRTPARQAISRGRGGDAVIVRPKITPTPHASTSPSARKSLATVVEREGQALRRPDHPSLFEFYQLKHSRIMNRWMP